MSLWLQEEKKKLDEYRVKRTPTSKHIIVSVIVLVVIEAALFLANPYLPDYNTRPLCGIVGVMGLMIIMIFSSKSKTTADKPKLPFATKCIENLHFSPEELHQFDTEMMAAPLALIKTNSVTDLPIRITEHYITAFFLEMGEPDYGVFRLSDIAMTCYYAGKSASSPNPLDKTYGIDLLDAKGEKMGGISIDGQNYFTELNAALEKYAPHIQLNVPMKDVKRIRKNS